MTPRMSSRTSKPIPTPVAAALGIVPTVLDGARRLPGKAVVLPVLAVSIALNTLETVKKEYDELAGRGERLVTRLLGGSPEEPEDRVEETVAVPIATVETLAPVAAPEVPAPGDLPLADYDQMTLGSLRGRIRSLTVSELVRVRDYEKVNGHRPPVITLLDHRIAKLVHDAAASPSPKKSAPRPKVRAT